MSTKEDTLVVCSLLEISSRKRKLQSPRLFSSVAIQNRSRIKLHRSDAWAGFWHPISVALRFISVTTEPWASDLANVVPRSSMWQGCPAPVYPRDLLHNQFVYFVIFPRANGLSFGVISVVSYLVDMTQLVSVANLFSEFSPIHANITKQRNKVNPS